MSEVLLLAGAVDPGDLRVLGQLCRRLGERGLAARIGCAVAGRPVPEGLEISESPGLLSRWRRDWSVRTLDLNGARRPDLVHIQGPAMAEAGLAIAEHWSLPYVLTIDEFAPPGATLRLSRRWCRGLIASSGDLAGELVGAFGIPRAQVEVIPAGQAVPEPEEEPAREGLVPVVGTSGNLIPGGGLPTFFQAARQLRDVGLDVEFVVDGQGRDEAALRRLAARMGIAERVTFADDVDLGPAFWKVLDVYCRSALVPDSGRTLGAALAFGVPVVVSDVPGLRSWIVPGQTGLLIPPGDAAALAGAIRSLLADRDEARRLGQRARAWIGQWRDPEAEADALAALYRRALVEPAAMATGSAG